MAEIKISVYDKDGMIIAQVSGEETIVMVYEQEYQPGDKIVLQFQETHKEYVIRIDDCLDESRIYVTAPQIVYDIPFEQKKRSYNPKAFSGSKHYITVREIYDHEYAHYRNLAKNVMDQHAEKGYYPHASANVETRGEAVFEAKNAIDGVIANLSHGEWPYASWGINQRADAMFQLDFGRSVSFDMIVIYTRADFPHDNWWIQGRIDFSDGSHEIVSLQKTHLPQQFKINREGITWLRLSELIKGEDPSPFPALTQIEVYGTEDY